MFYIKLKDIKERSDFIKYMKDNGILTVFHYIPLHTAPAGIKYGRFNGEDRYTTRESERLVRLPLYYGLEEDKVDYICDRITGFFKKQA
jgi:dTDP-4-amino-4,6-dideoxygalactose transaminase